MVEKMEQIIDDDVETVETIPGFNIPKRQLTEEEADREITIERLQEFMAEIGEDLFDQVGDYLCNYKIFGGFMLAKHPDKYKDILFVMDEKHGSNLDYLHIFEDEDENSWEIPYRTFCEFANLTVGTKRRTNQILIQVMERYE